MLKYTVITIVTLLFFNTAKAQKQDTTVYFINSTGTLVSTADNADYFLMILPPDTSVDKNLFLVKEYYKNGKIRMVGNSKTNSPDLKFQGAQISYYLNGHRMSVCTFEDGNPVGEVLAYYPSGKFHYSKSYVDGNPVLFNECRDSLGLVLTEHGTGRWIEYDENLYWVSAVGDVRNGHQDGAWQGALNDSTIYRALYDKGKLIFSTPSRKYLTRQNSPREDDSIPKFPGGYQELYVFLGRNIRYPARARQNDTQGTVVLSFIVEKDGTLTNFNIEKRVGDGCDEEAMRVMKLSPRWQPGLKNGSPISTKYTIPVSFKMERN